MDEITQTQPGATTGSTGGATTSQTPGGAAGAQTGATGGGTGGWSMPAKWAGKSPEDIARAYAELETQHGKHTQELGDLRKTSQWAQQHWSQWGPIIQQFGNDPNRLVQAFESMAAAARARGDQAGAQQAHQAAQSVAQQAWAQMIDPADQQRYLEGQFTGLEKKFGETLTQREKALVGQLQEQLQSERQYNQRFADSAIKIVLAAARNPNFDVNRALQRAQQWAQGGDPLQWAIDTENAPTTEQQRAQMEKEIRAQIALESRNAQETTAVGVGGAPKVALTPKAAPPPNRPEPPRRAGSFMAGARERAVGKIARILNT